VRGAITSHGGNDFAAISAALTKENYRFGALIIDAVNFVPQSRPRLFIVGICNGLSIPENVIDSEPSPLWHPKAIINAKDRLSKQSSDKWVWWHLPAPPKRNVPLSALIDDNPTGIDWHSENETQHILNLMTELNLRKVDAAKLLGRTVVGTVYRRTRPDGSGRGRQRAEVRFDEVAGCLRTPVGGSSRQTILIVNGDQVRSRLLSPRETARLMGLPEEYILPQRYNDAYHLAGDGVVVPVVQHLAEHILEPILLANRLSAAA
jgi:DNA (cytosine-5)-methyltransferase 1